MQAGGVRKHDAARRVIRPYGLPREIGNPDPRIPRSFSGQPRYQRPPRYRPISEQVAAETSAPAGSPAPPSSAPEPKSKYLPIAPMATSNKTAPRSPQHPLRGVAESPVSGFPESGEVSAGIATLQANRKLANFREDRPAKAPPQLASRNPEIPVPLCIRIARRVRRHKVVNLPY